MRIETVVRRAPEYPPLLLSELIAPGDWTRDAQARVIARIRSAPLSAAWKRTRYGEWLTLMGLPITARALDAVIGRRGGSDDERKAT